MLIWQRRLTVNLEREGADRVPARPPSWRVLLDALARGKDTAARCGRHCLRK